MDGTSEHLDAETCRAKAAECRRMAERTLREPDRIMLFHMAETWERVAKTFDSGM